ncbi:MAG: sensor histidine kinase [Cytophagaceae bacterium]
MAKNVNSGSISDSGIEYSRFVAFVKYLLEENFEEQIIEDNIQRSKEIDLPIFQHMFVVDETSLRGLFKDRFIERFLRPISEGRGMESSVQNLENWKSGLNLIVSKDRVTMNDIFLIVQTRKATLINFLTNYSKEPSVWTGVLEDLEAFFGRIQLLSIDAYQDILQDRLERNDRILNTIIDSMPVIITSFDENANYLEIKGSGLKYIGLKENELVGKNLYDAYPDAENLRYVFQNQNSHRFEGHITYNGEKRVYDNFYFPDKAGGITGFSLDITDRKKVEDKLRASEASLSKLNSDLEERVIIRTEELENSKEELLVMNEELKSKNDQLIKINNDLDNFIYTASHDLKAPISNIEGLVEHLSEQDLGSKDFHTLMEMIHLSIKRFKDTIQDLTEIAKIQRGQDDINELNNLEDLLRGIEEDLSKNINEVKPIVERTFSVNEIVFPKKDLRSILMNLYSNSLKYHDTSRKSHITIESGRLGGKTFISFRDNGLGIPENKRELVFQMFKRAHQHVEGTGLGLYIVKRIMENHGGRVELESNEGEGTAFTLFFPG